MENLLERTERIRQKGVAIFLGYKRESFENIAEQRI
jgi:hypothetical protein